MAPEASARRRILVIAAHPRPDSFSDALAEAYVEGAEAAGAEVRVLLLRAMDFARDVTSVPIAAQPTEPDIARARDDVAWAQHLVFVYPTWWGTHPALMKAFLDRLLAPGWAFRDIDRPPGFEGLLKGRSGHIITTMDTPAPVYRLLYRAPGHNALARATLGFCGIAPVRVRAFGPVKASTAVQRERWIAEARGEGLTLAGSEPAAERLGSRITTWLRALRLQFYPMAWAAYTLGAMLAGGSAVFETWPLWLGYLLIVLMEAATVFVNDRFDLESDRQNAHHSPFTGGSRVLVEGALRPRTLLVAAAACTAGGIACATVLVQASAQPVALAVAIAVLIVLALGYTLPPLRLSYRTVGELDVAITHSIGVVLIGWMVAGGAPSAAAPWLASLPLGLAVLPSIILSGLPDRTADAAVGKRTIAVALGERAALAIALAATVAAALVAILWESLGMLDGLFGGLGTLSAAHGVFIAALLGQRLVEGVRPGRLDGLMVATLSYIVWFVGVPLVNLS